MNKPRPLLEDAEGRRAARAFALWHLGDAEWADMILSAYEHPEATRRALAAEKAQYSTRDGS